MNYIKEPVKILTDQEITDIFSDWNNMVEEFENPTTLETEVNGIEAYPHDENGFSSKAIEDMVEYLEDKSFVEIISDDDETEEGDFTGVYFKFSDPAGLRQYLSVSNALDQLSTSNSEIYE